MPGRRAECLALLAPRVFWARRSPHPPRAVRSLGRHGRPLGGGGGAGRPLWPARSPGSRRCDPVHPPRPGPCPPLPPDPVMPHPTSTLLSAPRKGPDSAHAVSRLSRSLVRPSACFRQAGRGVETGPGDPGVCPGADALRWGDSQVGRGHPAWAGTGLPETPAGPDPCPWADSMRTPLPHVGRR